MLEFLSAKVTLLIVHFLTEKLSYYFNRRCIVAARNILSYLGVNRLPRVTFSEQDGIRYLVDGKIISTNHASFTGPVKFIGIWFSCVLGENGVLYNLDDPLTPCQNQNVHKQGGLFPSCDFQDNPVISCAVEQRCWRNDYCNYIVLLKDGTIGFYNDHTKFTKIDDPEPVEQVYAAGRGGTLVLEATSGCLYAMNASSRSRWVKIT